ncbi:MAG: CRISPR-associated endonuclease Cas1 [Thainema sp.]
MNVQTEQLVAAWHLVQRGSQAAGIDGISVDLFAGIAQAQIRQMQTQLRRQSYAASPARGIWLPKKNGGRRLIGIPTVEDRIVQRFLLQTIYPYLEETFSDSCFAYRPGLSIYQAVAKVMEFYQHQPAWVVKADIQQFFDNLSWPILLEQLEALGLRSETVQLLEQQLKAGISVNGRRQFLNKGVLQGSSLSGALANLYLSQFDHTCLEYGIPLVRYGDDCIVVSPSWMQAHRALDLITDLLDDLYLSLHPEKTQILAPHEPFTFLGHQFSNGQVIAPERKYPIRAAQPKAAKAPQSYGPPKACSIVKTKRRRRSADADTYWSEPMTTLYVTDQGAYLRARHKQFQVFHEQELKISVPVNQVSHVVLFGCCNLSHGAVSLALQRKIPVLYLASNGRYFGRLDTEGHAQIDYLTKQVEQAQKPEFTQRQAQSIILAKLHNSRVVLKRMQRKRPTELAEDAIAAIPDLMQQIEQAESIETMLGFEGQAANLYFRAYASLLKGGFEFEKRTRRPPTDPVNSLLSLGYTLLSQNLHSMVETVGLHTHFGNLHKPQKNRPSLVCDLIEEFRAPVVDACVAYLINSNIFTEEDFTPPDARGGVYLQPDALKKFLQKWEEFLNKKVTHPSTGHKVNYRRCFELQVWEYVACLMGEREVYRPMRWSK